ncbi:MAG TPA: hypothetical protein DCS93_06285 [Microscillaceae bacterium]|nr:hypothetical protein [Microscillaceae bacterium]
MKKFEKLNDNKFQTLEQKQMQAVRGGDSWIPGDVAQNTYDVHITRLHGEVRELVDVRYYNEIGQLGPIIYL